MHRKEQPIAHLLLQVLGKKSEAVLLWYWRDVWGLEKQTIFFSILLRRTETGIGEAFEFFSRKGSF